MSEYHQIDYNDVYSVGQMVAQWEHEISDFKTKIKNSFSKSLVKELSQNWVRGFGRKDAAKYVGVSSTKFDSLIDDGRMPKPVRIDGRVVWDRNDLDECFELLKEVSDAQSNAWFDNDPRSEEWT